MAFKKEDFENDADFKAFCAELVRPHEATNQGLKEDIAKLKEKAKLFEGIDIAKLKADSEKLEQLIKEKQGNENEFEKALRIQKETHESEMKSIKGMLEQIQTKNRTLIVDDTIKNELIGINCNPVLMPAAIAAIKPLVSIITENNIEVAKIGDESIQQYIAKWKDSEIGKHFCLAKRNTGGGTPQANQQEIDANSKYFDKKSKDFNRTKQMEIKKSNVELYNNLVKLYA